jgi:hypothetical protein
MNPNALIVARAWPGLWASGMLSVARPATNYDLRDYDMEQRRKDLARRAAAYQRKKKQ